jgi:hypothetical protein
MAWGENTFAQLGNGNPGGKQFSPRLVSGVHHASAIFAGSGSSFALLGPSQSLDIELSGSGKGVVGGQRILCRSTCQGRFPRGQMEILRAEPAPGSHFVGFSGACKGKGPCLVQVSQDQKVTATFAIAR